MPAISRTPSEIRPILVSVTSISSFTGARPGTGFVGFGCGS